MTNIPIKIENMPLKRSKLYLRFQAELTEIKKIMQAVKKKNKLELEKLKEIDGWKKRKI